MYVDMYSSSAHTAVSIFTLPECQLVTNPGQMHTFPERTNPQGVIVREKDFSFNKDNIYTYWGIDQISVST